MKIDRGDGKGVELHEMFKPFEEHLQFFVMGIHAAIQSEFQNQFSGSHDIEAFNKLIKRKVRSDGKINAKLSPLLIHQYQMIVIAAYETLMASKYNSQINKLSVVRFLKRLRDGCAHGNEFSPPIKNSVEWRGKVINDSLYGAKVIGEFINFSELWILFADISEILKKIDDKWIKK